MNALDWAVLTGWLVFMGVSLAARYWAAVQRQKAAEKLTELWARINVR
jgi:hypothetical protein